MQSRKRRKKDEVLAYWRSGEFFGWWVNRTKGKEMLELSMHSMLRLARINNRRLKEN